MNYKLFFDIQIKHQYFEPESCEDLVIHPSQETARIFKGQHLIVKKTNVGIQVLIPLDEKGNIKVNLSKEDVMSFLIFPSTAGFSAYTDLSALDEGEVFSFTNLKLTKSAKELKWSMVKENHVHQGFSCLAKVDIHPTGYLLNEADHPKIYTLTFNAQSIKWKYYFLSTNGNTNLSIEDKQKEILFEQEQLEAQTSDNIGKSLVEGYPSANILLFESKTPVPKTQLARKNLQLLRNGHIVIHHLPNPSVHDGGVKIINMQK